MTVIVAAVAVTACSRLTFVKPDLGRRGYEQVAPKVRMTPDSYDSAASKARVLVQDGQTALSQGDLVAAGKAADQALKAAPDLAITQTLAALVAERRGDNAKAGTFYRRAVELSPQQGGMQNNYGTWLCSNGRARESLEWFGRALADPGYRTPAVAMANAGACADDAGLSELAGVYLERAIQLDPANPVALGAMAQREFRAGDAFRARAFSERRLAAAPADRNALVLASQIEEKLGDKEAAAGYVRRLRVEFPGSPGLGTGDDGK
ncbi:MAG: type IV pilus biogenesis/stability protein PilW [Lysobacter sp.]